MNEIGIILLMQQTGKQRPKGGDLLKNDQKAAAHLLLLLGLVPGPLLSLLSPHWVLGPSQSLSFAMAGLL